jgi:PPOX class probable F420-dependent enzyme
MKMATAERAEAMANATQDDSRYIALTTYRRDGRAVTTPVWAVSLDGRIYVFTASSTGKAKRVRATGRVRFAPSSMNGRGILGAWREGTVVQDEALQERALAALQRKYGWQLSVAMLVYRLRGLYRDRVVLELIPAARA